MYRIQGVSRSSCSFYPHSALGTRGKKRKRGLLVWPAAECSKAHLCPGLDCGLGRILVSSCVPTCPVPGEGLSLKVKGSGCLPLGWFLSVA